MPKPLPTTTSTFRKIIEGEYLYIDKTEHIYQIAQTATGAYFLTVEEWVSLQLDPL